MYTKSDSAIQLGYFLVDFLWMRCEQDLEQADVDPGEIEVVEAAAWTGFNSTFQFPSFIKRDEIQEEESILTTARVLARASLQQWQVEHVSTFQVFRSQETAHSTIRNHWAWSLTLWDSNVNDLYTWQLMLCEPKWTFSMCVFQRLYCRKLLYWFKGGRMIPWPVGYFPVGAVNCLWNEAA